MPAPELTATPAIAYLRTGKGERSPSSEAQREAIRGWARTTGARIVAWHLDDGQDDAAPVDERKGLLAAVLALKTKQAPVLVVASRDRLARTPVTLALIAHLAARHGARLQWARGDRETPEEAAKLVGAFAEFERAAARLRSRAAVAMKRARGEAAGRCPWGYRLGEDKKTLVPDEREQDVIAVVRAMRQSGRKIREIVEALRDMGVVGRNGKPVGATRVFEMIQGGRKRAGSTEVPDREPPYWPARWGQPKPQG